MKKCPNCSSNNHDLSKRCIVCFTLLEESDIEQERVKIKNQSEKEDQNSSHNVLEDENENKDYTKTVGKKIAQKEVINSHEKGYISKVKSINIFFQIFFSSIFLIGFFIPFTNRISVLTGKLGLSIMDEPIGITAIIVYMVVVFITIIVTDMENCYDIGPVLNLIVFLIYSIIFFIISFRSVEYNENYRDTIGFAPFHFLIVSVISMFFYSKTHGIVKFLHGYQNQSNRD
jgi:hypothetical protein